MNARQMLPPVQQTIADGGTPDEANLYEFAARVAEAQKEIDAKLAEVAGADEVAQMIRAAQ